MQNDFSVNKLSFTLTLSLGRVWPSPISQFTPTFASWDWVARDRGWRPLQQNGTPLPEWNTSVVSDGFRVGRWDMVWEVNAEYICGLWWPWIIFVLRDSRAAFTFSETPCGSAAAVLDDICCRLVRHLSPAILFRRRSPHHTSHVTLRLAIMCVVDPTPTPT